MHRIFQRIALALLSALIVLPFSVSVALAHGHIEVGEYELVIGFKNEPAYQGEPNGLDLRVTNKQTGEKINDLADTLTAEVMFGGSKKEVVIRPVWGEDGAYTANVLPTEAGDYTWHIWGDIKGTPVDVSMISSPETFSAVQAKSTVAFPAAEPTTAELRGEIATANQTARVALIVGGLGVLAGLIGVVAAIRARSSRAAAQSTGQPQHVA